MIASVLVTVGSPSVFALSAAAAAVVELLPEPPHAAILRVIAAASPMAITFSYS